MRGRIAQIDSAEAVFSSPVHLDVARFVGIDTLIPGRVAGTANSLVQVDCGEVRIEAEGEFGAGEDVYVAVRPEEIELYDEKSPDACDACNVVAGQVVKLNAFDHGDLLPWDPQYLTRQ